MLFMKLLTLKYIREIVIFDLLIFVNFFSRLKPRKTVKENDFFKRLEIVIAKLERKLLQKYAVHNLRKNVASIHGFDCTKYVNYVATYCCE